jgi:hypothetical protein
LVCFPLHILSDWGTGGWRGSEIGGERQREGGKRKEGGERERERDQEEDSSGSNFSSRIKEKKSDSSS